MMDRAESFLAATPTRRLGARVLVFAMLASYAGCGTSGEGARDGADPTTEASTALDATAAKQTFALNVTAVDTTFVTEDHFIAAVEMQISGEPFAQAMGRDVTGYHREYICQVDVCSPSMYYDPASSGADGGVVGVVDIPGFSSAIESYEYSKQPMNNIAFESGAGTSLLFGPVLNPDGATGSAALALAQTWFLRMASESNAVSRFVSDANPLGWPGLWPVLQPFSSWNPSIAPTNEAGCSISSDDDSGSNGALECDRYECDYSTLHLPNRTAQVSLTIGPGSSGWTDWKEALWTLNYLQLMHDSQENPATSISSNQLKSVGQPGNAVSGGLVPGMYLGSSDIEGFQAGNFIQILDNQAAQWLLQLTTTDGATLGGFSTLTEALAYGTQSPLRWFPASISLIEANDASGFPRPASYAIASPDSHLLDLAGLLGAYASAYSLTDQANTQVGGSQPVLAYFDGDPFPCKTRPRTGKRHSTIVLWP